MVRSRDQATRATRTPASSPSGPGRAGTLAGSGGRAQPHPGGSGVPLDVGVREHLVVAEGAADQGGGDDRHALGAQPTALDVGTMDADERDDRDTQEAAEG